MWMDLKNHLANNGNIVAWSNQNTNRTVISVVGKDSDINNATIKLNVDGSSQFAGDMAIGTTGSFTPSAPATSLKADGSIKAAGPVDIGGGFKTGETNNRGMRLSPSGPVQVQDVADSDRKMWRCLAGTVETSSVKADGSATFKQTINVGGKPWTGEVGGGISPAGEILATNGASNSLFQGRQSGSTVLTSQINGDGSAKFASYVESDRHSGSRTFLAGELLGENYGLLIKNDPADTVIAGIKTDGSASFTSKPSLSTHLDVGGISINSTNTKTFPSTENFDVTAGLGAKIEIGNSGVYSTGRNNVYGNQFWFTKSAGNTQDIEGIRYIILNNASTWSDLNTCNMLTGINNVHSYEGIDANGKTTNSLKASQNSIYLNCPDTYTQTINSVLQATEYLSITPNGSSTVNIDNSFGESLSMFNSTPGTKTINIKSHTFMSTFYNGWGVYSFGTPGTLTANITNLYGLRLRPPGSSTGLTITNNWGIYQEWKSSKNWFAGASNQFPNITTTASGANAFLDSGNSNRLFRSTSSIIYKKDIEDLETSYADKILGLRSVWYRSKCENDRSDWSYYGFIAEEVAAIDPRLVHYGYQEDAYETVSVTETVNIPEKDPRFEEGVETEEVTYEEVRLKADAEKVPDGVAYDRFVVPLLAIIKRQQTAIEALESRLDAAGL